MGEWLIPQTGVIQLAKKFPSLYGTQKFITAFTRAHHLSLSWDISILILSFHLQKIRSKLIPWSTVLFETLTCTQPVKFATFYGTQTFITAHTRAHHLSLSWDISILILSFRLQKIRSKLIPWSTVLLETLTCTQPVKFATFMEPKRLLPHAQEPTTCPYPGPYPF